MQKMNHKILAATLVGVMFIGAACEWTSSGDSGSWNEEYSWVNFSGVYRSPNGGPIVMEGQATGGDNTYNKTDDFGVMESRTTFSGRTSVGPIVPGSFTARFGNQVIFTDDGSGGLIQAGDASVTPLGSGVINYHTGAWGIKADSANLSGLRVTADYSVQASEVAAQAGNTGKPVMNLSVSQTGNQLSMTDNRGMVFSGRVTGSNGIKDQTTQTSIRLNFEVQTADGAIKIKGAFTGDWSGTDTDGDKIIPGVLSNRVLEGTWLESKAQGAIYAVSAPTVIPTAQPVTPPFP